MPLGRLQLEHSSQHLNAGELKSQKGDTDIFIYPGFKFQVVDAMITNFHLPKSSLLMLVSAFIGFEEMHQTYQHAIHQGVPFL